MNGPLGNAKEKKMFYHRNKVLLEMCEGFR